MMTEEKELEESWNAGCGQQGTAHNTTISEYCRFVTIIISSSQLLHHQEPTK